MGRQEENMIDIKEAKERLRTEEFRFNKVLDIVNSIDDIKWLQSQGFDTDKILNYYNNDNKKLCDKCQNYQALYLGCDSYKNGCKFEYPDIAYTDRKHIEYGPHSRNRHGLCIDYRDTNLLKKEM